MKLSIWVPLAMVVAFLGLVAGVLGSAYGLFMLAYELLVDTGEWDGFGIIFGLLVLSVTLPLAISFFVLLRLLRRPDPAPGVVGTTVAIALLVATMAIGPGTLWAMPGLSVTLLVVAVVASIVSAPAAPSSASDAGRPLPK